MRRLAKGLAPMVTREAMATPVEVVAAKNIDW